MKKSGKCLSILAVALVLVLSISICAQAAQIDTLNFADGVFDAYVTGISEDGTSSKLYVAEESDGAVSVANSYSIEEGMAEGTTEITDGRIYIWDATSLAPLSLPYDLIGGRVYEEGSDVSVPGCATVIVTEISDGLIKGYESGTEAEYVLAETVTVTGMAEEIADVKPGSVVTLLFDREGNVAELELLTPLTGTRSGDYSALMANCGERAAADGSERYANVIGVYYSLSGRNVKVRFIGDEFENGDEQKKYTFEKSAKNYVVSMTDDGAVESVTGYSDFTGLKELTGSNLVFAYMRYDTVDEVVKEAVFYYFPEDIDFTGGGEYSDPFELTEDAEG